MRFLAYVTSALVGVTLVGPDQAMACGGCRSCCSAPAASAGPPSCCGPAAADSKDAGKAASDKEAAEIRESLAKLSAEDRKLAEAQKWCAIEDESRLGSMGVPMKILVKGEPVFLCCKG